MSDPRLTPSDVPEDLPGNRGSDSVANGTSATTPPRGADLGSLDYAPNTDSVLPSDSGDNDGEAEFNRIEHNTP